MSSKLTNLFKAPILQSFIVKTNITINLDNLAASMPISSEEEFASVSKGSTVAGNGPRSAFVAKSTTTPELACRSGTIIALKYKDTFKGKDDLFKTKTGFKNACHLIMCHTMEKRRKKLIHVKITAVGTFQVVGIPAADVEKVVYKVFLILEKTNKKHDVFVYNEQTKTEINRLEIVIVPILNNYMLTLTPQLTHKIFKYSKLQIIQTFIDNNFLSFMVPNDPAITIKKSFTYKDFSAHPIRYITWSRKYGKTTHHIEYDSYTTLLKDAQKENAQHKKYLTLRLYSTGKVLVSGFNEIIIKEGVENFLETCEQQF